MPDEQTPAPAPPASPGPPDRIAAFRWPLVIVFLGLFALIAYVVSLRTTKQVYDETLDRAGNRMDQAARAAVDIAARFRQGTITETFTAAIPEISGTGMGNLELATAQTTETFTRTDTKTIAWDTLYIGTTTTEIKVPVTYRYHLKLAEPWQLDVSGQTCIVIAPPIRPSLPPAIHTDGMEKKSDRGWARFNVGEQMGALEKEITPRLNLYARDPRNINLAREEGRKTVAEFVKAWLMKEDHWRTNRFHTIKVIFADEAGQDAGSMAPTITIRE
jgi:hypothetical protein